MGYADIISKYDKACDLIINMVNDSKLKIEVPESEKKLFENKIDLQVIKSITSRFTDFDYKNGMIFIKK
jgi:hypothetical protein